MSTVKLQPQTIITTHLDADFDALGSMVAAHKLYPNATLIAPTFFNRNVTHDFLENIPQTFSFVQPKDCDFSKVSQLIVVDTRHPSRIEHVKDVLLNTPLTIHLYDHHQSQEGDLTGEIDIYKPYGSATTILVELIQEKNITLTEDEATLLALGIYEDTGRFTHNSTTPEDLKAATFLMEKGINKDTIKSLTSDMTGEEIQLLGTLLRNKTTRNINGCLITLTEISLNDHFNDFSSLAEHMMQVDQSITTLIALGEMGERVYIVARSTDDLLDLGHLCSFFGGGGHRSAASASLKNQPLAEVKARVLEEIITIVTASTTVEVRMTSPAKALINTQTLAEAEDIMTRYGLKAAPVIHATTKKCMGILEQNISSKALTHKLGHLPVTEFMQRSIQTLSPDAPLKMAISIVVHERQRLIPIIKDELLIGVLTRTDLIKLLIDEPTAQDDSIVAINNKIFKNLAKQLYNQINPERYALLQTIGKLADKYLMNVFIVGGFVRDLILRHGNEDYDISIEGSAIDFAEELAKELNGRVRTHEKFNTAIVFYQDADQVNFRVDIASSRLEYYEHPAALPTIELSSIKMDLYRRDFTINAMAIQINEKLFGSLIDPFGGQRDLKNKNISVLHSLSFVEDPTRILRAIRFEQRFSFKINAQTERLIKNALKLGMLEKLSGSRLFHELELIFEEAEPIACFDRMEELGLLQQIHSLFFLNPQKRELLQNIEGSIKWYQLLAPEAEFKKHISYLLGLSYNAKYQDVTDLASRLGFTTKEGSQFARMRESIKNTTNELISLNEREFLPSELYEALKHTTTEILLFLMARYGQTHKISQNISLYITKLKNTRLKISGTDLESFGEKPGPLFGETLRHVLHACLNGQATSKEEQLSMANDYMFNKDRYEKELQELLSGRL